MTGSDIYMFCYLSSLMVQSHAAVQVQAAAAGWQGPGLRFAAESVAVTDTAACMLPAILVGGSRF
jgi:hypothetical protein